MYGSTCIIDASCRWCDAVQMERKKEWSYIMMMWWRLVVWVEERVVV